MTDAPRGRSGSRRQVVSPVLLQPVDETPEDAREVLLTDEASGRRMALVELRIRPGTGAGAPYGFGRGAFYALDANAVIKAPESKFSGAHSDIRHPEITWAIASAAGIS